jgi:hypothetical protein
MRERSILYVRVVGHAYKKTVRETWRKKVTRKTRVATVYHRTVKWNVRNRVWAGFLLQRIGTTCGQLWIPQWNFRFAWKGETFDKLAVYCLLRQDSVRWNWFKLYKLFSKLEYILESENELWLRMGNKRDDHVSLKYYNVKRLTDRNKPSTYHRQLLFQPRLE